MTMLATLRSTEHRLKFWRSVCGCNAGALAVLVALGWVATQFLQGAALNTTSVIRAAVIVVGTGIAAKLVAILAARALYVVDAALFAHRSRRLVPDERVGT